MTIVREVQLGKRRLHLPHLCYKILHIVSRRLYNISPIRTLSIYIEHITVYYSMFAGLDSSANENPDTGDDEEVTSGSSSLRHSTDSFDTGIGYICYKRHYTAACNP